MTGCKKILYFGLDPSRYIAEAEIIHLPLIETCPFPYEKVKSYFAAPHTHVLFTSRMGVTYFFDYTDQRDKLYICVGKATAARLADFGLQATLIADDPCGEGVVDLLNKNTCTSILYPHSAQARPLLPNYIQKRGTPFALYETKPHMTTLPDLTLFDKFVFTSPSTVAAFAVLCPSLPAWEKCEAIGPVTRNALKKLFG